ncbi:MAG: ATP-binding protein [Woeseiaceae bacterium]
MNLRKQLLLVSLLTLILPWAGCQFIRETESALREVQEEMLGGYAKAITDSLSQFHDELLSDDHDGDLTSGRLYAHPLQRGPLVDGYIDEWSLPTGARATLRGIDGPIRYAMGSFGQYWYLHVDVRDANIVYARQTDADDNRAFADGVILTSVERSGESTEFRFQAEAPGKINAIRRYREQSFEETRILAHWQDTATGYSFEARIPKGLVASRVGVAVVNTNEVGSAGVVSANFSGAVPGSLIAISPVLQSVATGYVQDGLRLIVTDKDGWRLAQAGSVLVSGNAENRQQSGWLRIIYNLLLEPGADAALAEPAPGGREQQSYISEALQGRDGAARWFRSVDTGRAVVSVAQPIWSGTVQTGAVVLQQGTDAILSLTNTVLTRLAVLTLIAMLVVAVVLIGYASWLSLRIQRLSNAAEHALDENKLQVALPSALSGDEVGDLSRSFSSILKQLGTYNEYLQTLATKLSHELRTPLTIVRSSLENLEHEDLSADAHEYAARAKEGTDRLQKILSAMSEANRTEELIENVEPETFELSAVLDSTVSAYADAWPQRDFQLQRAEEATYIHGSPELIIQMLDKLVDNAVDFTGPGDTITVSVQSESGEAIIAVSNPGRALPEDMQERLFDSMVSVRSGDPGKHLGLGLYIARVIAEGHGGSIEATNTHDGVTIQIRIPAARN